ncbi:MAG: UDP-3-O-(3-hydroxymyristoyl)glucosamine N-acyltransferase [Alphaproteobacteria bacterium]|nr:UDP-3-O-(3-hydroxymyristoyl)glucosamine N-acyltransferase [Alphaproteobacteria bacterium]
MADDRFFKRGKPLPLARLAELAGTALVNAPDENLLIRDVAPVDRAGPCDITFFDNRKYRQSFQETRAGACLVSPESVRYAPPGTALLVTKYPYKAYAHIASIFYGSERPDPYISDRAFIDETATVGRECTIEPGAVIGPGAEIGNGCWIEANAVIGQGVVVGEQCRIGAGSTLSHCLIGKSVRLYPGVRVGQDGFGFAIDPNGHIKVPQLGRVIIEDRCEIGANTCIDRGAGPDTVIGAGTWIDNLVQIGHNVRIGRGCVIVAQAGVAGSTVLEDFAVLGGQVGVAGHLTVGKGARIAAQSGIMRDVPPGDEMMGTPAVPIRQFMRQVAFLGRMVKKERN